MTLVEKNKTTILAPIAIGFALFATQLAGIQYTGAAGEQTPFYPRLRICESSKD